MNGPGLVRETERQLGLRFLKKPTLKLSEGGRPLEHMYKEGKHEIVITKRMAREDEEAAESAIRHELREVLISEHLSGAIVGQAHLFALQFESGRDIENVEGYYRRKRDKS